MDNDNYLKKIYKYIPIEVSKERKKGIKLRMFVSYKYDKQICVWKKSNGKIFYTIEI